MGTIQGFIERGFTFDDIRDEAVVVCYGIVDGMGYNGTVMCDGIIDNYGPHVWISFVLYNLFMIPYTNFEFI